MKAIAIAALILPGALGLFTQANATVGETASDASGALVPGVIITAVNAYTGVSNTSITKKIQIDEAKSFTLRVDAVNFLNRPVWGTPNTDINSNAFGRITTSTGARTITLSARMDF